MNPSFLTYRLTNYLPHSSPFRLVSVFQVDLAVVRPPSRLSELTAWVVWSSVVLLHLPIVLYFGWKMDWEWARLADILFELGLTLLFYACCSLQDPGYLPRSQGLFRSCWLFLTADSPVQVKNRLCEPCQLDQPLRTKHCRKCANCVERYDHHCFFIANCVGRRNHLTFVIYLSCQVWTVFHALLLCFPLYRTTQAIAWIDTNISVLLATVYLLIVLLFLIPLLVYQLVLVSSNQTDWEMNRRDSITYLKDIPEGWAPFDRGIIRNLYQFCWYASFCQRYLSPPVFFLFALVEINRLPLSSIELANPHATRVASIMIIARAVELLLL